MSSRTQRGHNHGRFSMPIAFLRNRKSKINAIRITSVLIIGALLFSLLFHPHSALASAAGPNGTGTSADNAGVGTVAWTNPTNATASDGVVTTQSLANAVVGHYLFTTNYGFNIPSAATINGVTVEVLKSATAPTTSKITDNSILLIKGGATTGTNQATTTTWPSSNTYVTYGGSANLMGATLAPSDVNASNFGVAISAKNVNISGGGATLSANIDYVRITITYTTTYTFNEASYRVFANTDASGSSSFAQSWGGIAGDVPRGMANTADGGYIAVGSTASFGAGALDAFITKYDLNGVVTFSKVWGGAANDIPTSVVQTSDGGYAVTGYTASFGAGLDDIFIIKYTSAGVLSWANLWGGNNYDQGQAIIELADSSLMITGSTNSTNFSAGLYDMALLKYSSTGTLTFGRTWGGTGTEIGTGLTKTTAAGSDTGVAISGYTNSTNFTTGAYDVFIVKYDLSGNWVFSRSWGGTGNDYGSPGIIQDSGGGLVLSGITSFGAGSNDVYLLKYDSTGAFVFSRAWGGTGSDYGYSVIQTSDSGYALTGRTASYGSGSDDMILLKYDSSGTYSYGRAWGGTGIDYGQVITQKSDGGFGILTGSSSFGAGIDDSLIVKYDSSAVISGCGTTCKVEGTDFTATKNVDGVGYTSTRLAEPTNYTSTKTSDGVGFTSTKGFDSNGSTTVGTSFTSTNSAPSPTITTVIANAPAMDVGSALAATNTAAIVPLGGTPFRLRMNVNVTPSSLLVAGQDFKLQYAALSGTCLTTPTGNFADVTNATTVKYYDNPNATSGQTMATNANDPTDGANALIRQSYQESGSAVFSNTVALTTGQDAMWDFALTTSVLSQFQHYCIRLVQGNGTVLNTYTQIAEIITPSTVPAAPTLITPASGANGLTTSPTFTLRTTDLDNDYVQYKILIYQSDCTTLVATADESASQTGWTGQDANGATAYVGNSVITSSTIATYTYTSSLTNSTTYCWKAAAMDPAGTGTFGPFSVTRTFSVGSPAIVISGGTVIRGGTRFGN